VKNVQQAGSTVGCSSICLNMLRKRSYANNKGVSVALRTKGNNSGRGVLRLSWLKGQDTFEVVDMGQCRRTGTLWKHPAPYRRVNCVEVSHNTSRCPMASPVAALGLVYRESPVCGPDLGSVPQPRWSPGPAVVPGQARPDSETGGRTGFKR
jgi:hypothetical protein